MTDPRARPTAPSPQVFAVFNEIGIIEQLARTKLERLLPDGLRISHFTVLNHFIRRPGQETPVQLARAFQVTKGAMTNTLGRLEGRGLIEIVPDPSDGRSKLVSISAAGRQAHADCLLALAPELEKIEAAFGRSAFAEALPFLAELRKWLDAERDEA